MRFGIVAFHLTLLTAVTASPAGAQGVGTAVVERNVNLRRDPSTTQPRIRLLKPPDELELLDSVRTNDYYHVRTASDEEGWVWARNVRVETDSELAIVAATIAG